MKFKQWHLLVLIGLLVIAGVFYFTKTSDRLGESELRVTYNPMPFNLPSMVEREQQFLAKQGFDVEYNTFAVGHAMAEALVAGELDVAVVMGGTSFITSVAGGRDLKIIASYSQAPSGFALVSTVDSWSIDQLVGKRIAVPFGTEAHYLLGKILQEQGLSFEEIELVNMLVPDGVAALQSGQVDGAMVVEPVLTRLVQNNQVSIIRDGTGLITGLTVSVVSRDLDQRTIDKFLAAQKKTLAYITDNYQEVLELASEETGLPLPLIQKIAPKYQFTLEIDEQVKNTLLDTIDFLYEQGIIRTKPDLNQLL